MQVTQVKTIVNAMANEALGATDLVLEDLSNIVDVGVAFMDAYSVDNYVKSLVDKISKVVFVDRGYNAELTSIMMDSQEYGAIVQKIYVSALPVAGDNETWQLVDGQTYDPNVYHAPQVASKFFSKRITFDMEMSFAEKQVKSAFNSVTELNAFFNMIETSISNAMNLRINELILRTITNFIADTLEEAANTAGLPTTKLGNISTNRAVNLLKLYNDTYTKTLTKDKAIYDADFLRFASYTMSLYVDHVKTYSKLFNMGHTDKFTPLEDLHIIMLSPFARASEVFLQSDVFHNELIKLPNGYETVQKWQGTGTDFAFDSVSKIHVARAGFSPPETVVDGILAVMFDRNALGVTHLDRRVTSDYNAKGEFVQNFYKFEAGYFNDQNENFIVFYVADPVA